MRQTLPANTASMHMHPLIISNKAKDFIDGRLLQQEFCEFLH